MKTLLATLTIIVSIQVQAQTNIGYAGKGYSNDVFVIDLDSMVILDTISDIGGYRMVLSNDATKLYSTGGGQYIYITDATADTLIWAFDPSRNGINTSELEAICLSPDGKKLYVFDESNAALFVMDTETDSIIGAREYNSFYEPENCICGANGSFVYMVDNDYVWKISTTTLNIEDSTYVGGDAHGISITADGQTIYSDGSDVFAINSATMDITDTFNASGYYIEVSKDGARAYAVNESNKLAVITTATNTLLNTITLSSGGNAGVTTDPTGSTIYSAGYGGIIRIDATSLNETGKTPLSSPSFQSIVYKYVKNTGIQNPISSSHSKGSISDIVPNPSKGTIQISTNILQSNDGRVVISDLSGKVVAEWPVEYPSVSHSLSIIVPGLYIVSLFIDGELADTKEFVISGK